jgi:signal transduction histidine kinase
VLDAHVRIALEGITMRKRGERTAAAVEQRARRVKTKVQGCEREISRLRERDRLKDEFIATLAHELRNPLAPIVSAAHVLAAGGTSRQLSVRACDVIRRQVRILTSLVDDLLDISRIVQGTLELSVKPVDLRNVLATATEMARPLLDQCGHTLKIRLRDVPLVVEGDPLRLTQVIANLLNNAAKYTNPGGIITVIAAPVGKDAAVRIRDTGVGIRPEQLSRIFELFAQAEPGSQRALAGLGIGLALARQLAQRHGGSLTAHSEGPDCGSEFTLTLPLAQRVTHAPMAISMTCEPAAAPHRRILIVEDDPDTADTMAAMLHLWGHEVVVARDGSTAISVAVTMHPDVMLVDIGLPALDGYMVAEAVSHRPETAGITLVAVTGYGRLEDRERCIRAGFCKHLLKPVDPEALIAALV